MFKNLIQWSQDNYTHLPWRQERTLYTTLVSEIMLQQTTVGTVLNHFEKFLIEYPSIQALANATEEDLTISWKGLGYYRRARNLHKACKFIADNFKGDIPLDYETLIQIPGIGPYTASALIAIGADKPALAIDANLERVLSRFYGIETLKGPKLQKEIGELFKQKKIVKNIEKLGPRDLNEALMDLGRTLCQARKASCLVCPLSSKCKAFKMGEPLSLPKQPPKKEKAKNLELHLLRIVCVKDGKLLVYKKKKNEWLSGQLEVPTFVIRSDDKRLKQYPVKREKVDNLPVIKSSITKYKITNYLKEVSHKKLDKLELQFDNLQWQDISETKNRLSSGTLKILILLNSY